MELRYRKEKAWSGKVYRVRMSRQEIEERRKLGVLISIFTMVPVVGVLMALAAGLLK